MTTRRRVLTVAALSGALLTTAAVPAQAASWPTPGGWPSRTCHTVYQVKQKVRVDACTDGTHRLFVWNKATRTWRLIWDR